MAYGRFPESDFPGSSFPGKSLSRKDVSRKFTFPERCFPEISLSVYGHWSATYMLIVGQHDVGQLYEVKVRNVVALLAI